MYSSIKYSAASTDEITLNIFQIAMLDILTTVFQYFLINSLSSLLKVNVI